MLRLGVKRSRSLRHAARHVVGGQAPHQLRLFSSSAPGNKDGSSKKTDPVSPSPSSFGLDSNVASEKFSSRWLMVLPAFGTHLCIGAPWAWSVMADVVTREIGFVAPAAADWSLYDAAFPLSIVFLMQGVSASLFGKWQMKVGARTALATSAFAFGGGMMLGAAGIHYHSLPLLYAGYGFLGGTGIGLAYTPPVATLMEWFPDKKGVASGLTIAGFGSGALLFTPTVQYLMKQFAKMPEYLGPVGSVATKSVDGKLFAVMDGGSLVEVVQAGAAELAKIPYTLPEGIYAVGTGSTGAAESLACIGMAYFSLIMAASMTLRRPHPNVAAQLMPTSTGGPGTAIAAVPNVSLEDAMKAPQFYLLGTTFFCIATGGMGIMSVAKPMMGEVFSSILPTIVTSAFAGKFVLMLASGNLGGRLAWAALSERVGRPAVFYLFTAGSVPLYFAMPTIVDAVVTSGSIVPLYGFCFTTALAVSYMGGVFAILPAYQADLFGSKFVGPIHGRMLLFSSVAALIGPKMLTTLRNISEKTAVTDLMSKTTPEKFQAAFGAPMEQASELLAAKTLSISKLMAIVPPGTLDPTPHLYDTTMYSLGGLMCASVIAHGMVRPIKPLVTIDVHDAVVNSTIKLPNK